MISFSVKVPNALKGIFGCICLISYETPMGKGITMSISIKKRVESKNKFKE
jgi:hypothetical protein